MINSIHIAARFNRYHCIAYLVGHSTTVNMASIIGELINVEQFMELKLAEQSKIVVENQLQSNFTYHKFHMT
jgi:hypothetical protein